MNSSLFSEFLSRYINYTNVYVGNIKRQSSYGLGVINREKKLKRPTLITIIINIFSRKSSTPSNILK